MSKLASLLVLFIIISPIIITNETFNKTIKINEKKVKKEYIISESSLIKSVTINQKGINLVKAYVTPDNSYKALTDLISSANESIDIMIYEFWSYNIFNVINQTVREKNVKVRILYEGSVYGSSGDPYNRWIMNMFYNLGEDGYDVRIRYDDTSRYVHAKVVIVDNKSVFVSSENFGETAYPPNPNYIEEKPYHTASRGFCVVAWNETIAKIFENIFLDEFNTGLDYTYSEGTEPPSYGYISYSAPFSQYEVVDENALLEAVFSPDNSTDSILNLINNAKHFILLELAYIINGTTVNGLINALKEARQRGVTVQIILEDDFGSYYNEIANNLINLGFYVVPAFSETTEPLFLHNKGIIVDDELVLVGSINWSDGSLTDNREAALLIRSSKIANFYKEVFAWDWNQSSNEPFDSDGDGLSNAYEMDHNLNKFSSDTDGDGLTDYDEVMIYKTDPSDAASPGVMITYPKDNQYIASKSISVEWEAHTTINNYYLYLNNSFLAKLDGSYISYDLSGLKDGSWYNFTLIAELSTGVNVSFSVLFAIDLSPPIISIVAPENNSVVLAGPLTISWSVIDFSPCLFNIYLNTSLMGTITGNNFVVDLAHGYWIVRVEAIDSAGNSADTQVYVHVKSTPSLEIAKPKDYSYTNLSLIMLTWSVSDRSLITGFRIYLNYSLIDEVNNATFSYELSLLEDGLYNLTVVAYSNKYGVLASATTRIIRDTVAPEISIVYPRNNSELEAGNIIVKWTCTDKSPVNFTLKLDGETKYSGSALRANIELTPGEHIITLIAIDAAGNKSTVNIRVNVRRELLRIILFTILVILIIVTLFVKIKKK